MFDCTQDTMLRYAFIVVLVMIQVNYNAGILQDQHKSRFCYYNGIFVDGKCDCNAGYYGRECMCFSGNSNQEDIQSQCKAPNSSVVCSGRGECICGMCDCLPRRGNSEEYYTGRLCECNDYDCPYHNNALCGGPTNGRCVCGSCVCNPDFTDDSCGCTTRNDNCIASDGSLCGGRERGRCVCNKCYCNTGSKYQGPTCEDCKDCNLCRSEKECVQCVAFGTGQLKDNCEKCRARENTRIKTEDSLQDNFNICEFIDDDDCIFFFSYEFDSRKKLEITVLKTKVCPAPYFRGTSRSWS